MGKWGAAGCKVSRYKLDGEMGRRWLQGVPVQTGWGWGAAGCKVSRYKLDGEMGAAGCKVFWYKLDEQIKLRLEKSPMAHISLRSRYIGHSVQR